MQQMHLPWYPADSNSVFLKERTIHSGPAIDRHNVHVDFKAGHLQERYNALHPSGNASDVSSLVNVAKAIFMSVFRAVIHGAQTILV